MRTDGRKPDQIRSIKIIPEINRYAEGSVQIEMGETKLICTATIEQNVPKWLMNSGRGWLSAEYSMLPRSTHTRIQRDRATSSGRSQEISRLIGRSLRAALDLTSLGERQILIDCDVIQADGGTRTAAISGGFVALALALQFLKDRGDIVSIPLKNYVAATSIGMKDGSAILDLNYDEDSTIETDMNFVMNDQGNFIEIQGTAESSAFSRKELDDMLQLAQLGCSDIFKEQAKIMGSIFSLRNSQ